jgi:hypothetical protein
LDWKAPTSVHEVWSFLRFAGYYRRFILDFSKIAKRFAPKVPWARQSFWAHLTEFLGDMGEMEGHFGLFGDSVNLDA